MGVIPALEGPLLPGDLVGPDRTEFASWSRDHEVDMLRLATRLVSAGEARDVVQSAWERAWQRRDQFDATRGTPRAWLLAITASAAQDALRAERRWFRRLARTTQAADAAPRVRDVEAGLDVDRACARLAPRQRLAVELFYFLDLPLRETAEVLGCSEGTAKSTLHDARAVLRTLLGGPDAV